jgi:Trpc4-associated protein
MNQNNHQSRRNPRLEDEHFQTAMDFSTSTASTSSAAAATTTTTTTPLDRPVTRSLAKRTLQQQQQKQQEPNPSSSNFPNESSAILKYLQMQKQQQLLIKQQLPQKTYQKIIINEKPCNLINMLENSRLRGSTIRNTSNLPDITLTLTSQRLKTHDYPLLIKRLEHSSITINLRNGSKEVDDLLRILQDVENRLMNYAPTTGTGNESPNTTIREEFEVETINLESARVFRQYGGIEIFKRILLLNLLIADNNTNNNYNSAPTSASSKGLFLNRTLTYTSEYKSFRENTTNTTNNSFINNYIEKSCILKIKCKCIHILNRLVCLPNYGKLVVNDLLQLKVPNKASTPISITSPSKPTADNYDTTLLQYLFTLLMFKDSRLQACQLIESILLHMPMLNLNRINNIKLILESIDDDGLSCICKIFAVTLSNLDTIEKKYLASGQKRLQLQKQRMAAAQAAAVAAQVAVSNNNTNNSTNMPTTSANSENQNNLATNSASKPTLSSSPQSCSSILQVAPLSIRDQNQELLLRIPTLLFRLVNLVRRKDYAIRYPDANSEIEHWIRYIDQALSDTEEDFDSTNGSGLGQAGSSSSNSASHQLTTSNHQSSLSNRGPTDSAQTYFNADFNSTSNESSTNGERSGSPSRSTSPVSNPMYDNISTQPALVAAAKLNNFVYVLYTLSLLLIGKEKKKVQINLTKLRLASALNSLFDYLIWNCRCEYPNSTINNNNANPLTNLSQQGAAPQLAPPPAPAPQQQQMRSHICPEVAVKIQFLRLVHSFCDHSESKRVVLSKLETDEILNYNKTCHPCLKVDEQILRVENKFRCTKEKVGLLSKIVQVIKQEPFSASFRFWLIRAIESFLRGNTSYADQLFLIKRGIVEDTVQNILAINFTRPKEVLQSCFDMLGELVKFNTDGFDILNKELADTDKFNMLSTMINQSLIDSNMFLRSIFLSIDFFENNSHTLEYTCDKNKILSHFNLFDRRVLFLCRMISIININNLSQENVSCLNTTLIVLMLANRKRILPKYLLAIKAKSIEMLMSNDVFRGNGSSSNSSSSSSNVTSSASSSSTSPTAVSPPLDIVTNFRDLLIFWQSHYLQKDKDCGGLEQNSRIDFSYWKETVELLLDPNPKNKWSLNFYLQNDFDYMTDSNKNRLDELRSD